MRLRLRLLLPALVAVVLMPLPAHGYEPPEPYAPYQPQTQCRSSAQPGTKILARWLSRRFDGGAAVASVRSCGGGTSEHQDGRAIDWSMNATKRADRLEVKRFLAGLFKTDRAGHPHARARRMGIMYVIWNDRMYASYDRFAPKPYSPCKKPRHCSATLRHRDHVHISLSKRGARARATWYAGRAV